MTASQVSGEKNGMLVESYRKRSDQIHSSCGTPE